MTQTRSLYYIGKLLAAVLLCVLGFVATRIVAAEDQKTSDALYDPGLHLFADDVELERTWDVNRVLGMPRISPEPLIVSDKPWETATGMYIMNYAGNGSVIYDPELKKFRMWYGVLYQGADMMTKGVPSLECYAESPDGLHWTKPTLGLVDYNGSKDNNIVYTSKGLGLYSFMFIVLRDEAESDPARRYKGLGPSYPVGYFLVTSPDGLHWSAPPRLVSTVGLDTLGMTWDPARKLFIMGGRDSMTDKESLPFRGDPVTKGGKRVIGIFESKDMGRWKFQGRGLELDEEDGNGLAFQHWCLNPFNYGNQYLGLLYVASMRGASQIGWQELVSSRDGRQWRHAARHQSFLTQGVEHQWDSNSMLNIAGSPPIPVGDEVYIYFTSRANKGFPGVAILKRDRFIGIRAGDGLPVPHAKSYDDTGGTVEPILDGWHIPYVVTRPIRITDRKLQVNLQTGSAGVLRVSLRRPFQSRSDSGGQELPGFSGAECLPVKGDATRMEVRWKGDKDLSSLVGQDVVLMFEFKDATLWSFRFAN